VDRLAEDHRRARELASFLKQRPEVTNILPVDSNIVIFSLDEGYSAVEPYLKKLESVGIYGSGFGKNQVRMVTHLDFTDVHLDEFVTRYSKLG
jgi:threonine aldolase